jgi:toxin ParE1/3/4
MKLAFTPIARDDLREIGDYIARDSRREAQRFVTALQEFCRTLLVHPERYPLSPRHAAQAIRCARYRDYLIFYRIRDMTVEILRVLHAARDVETQTERL